MNLFSRKSASASSDQLPSETGDGDSAPLISIIPMRRRHVKSVVAIEREIFVRPWSPALYISELAQLATRRYYVATVNSSVIGYAGSMIVLNESHVTTVGVASEHQRKGVARALLYRLIVDAIELGAESATLEVRMSNHGAQHLYQSFGFVPAGIRKGYYPEVGEDALVMWAHDLGTDAYRERLASIAALLDKGIER